MASPELVVLDVGHGNCAIIHHEGRAVVIDAPSRPVVSQALDALAVQRIDLLLLSHSDADHVSGATALLMDTSRPVIDAYVNPDASKQSATWRDFRIAVRAVAGRARVINSLSSTAPGRLTFGSIAFDIIYPVPHVAISAVGGRDVEGQALDANSMSAIIRMSVDGHPICLFGGDADAIALGHIANAGADLTAPILVFPHHGGLPARTDAAKFARDFTQAVNPKLVLFSLGRGIHGTPRPEIMRGIREGGDVNAPAYLACTQLSKNCARDLPAGVRTGIAAFSAGLSKGECCAGSLIMPLAPGSETELIATLSGGHLTYVDGSVPGALCKRDWFARAEP